MTLSTSSGQVAVVQGKFKQGRVIHGFHSLQDLRLATAQRLLQVSKGYFHVLKNKTEQKRKQTMSYPFVPVFS